MEKPDFFKMAIDRNLYLAAPEVAEMCEIVWNTHVVPLQESLRIEREAHDKSMAEIKALREENTRLTTKFIEEEHAADHPNENLSYWQYQQFTRAAITKLRDQIVGLKNICDMDRKTEYQYTQLLKEKEALREEIEILKDQILEQGELDGN